ncbi:PRD domain-containing protein [uncultured Limosilactobacillus sp.]|uniref:BglG family transcription antiterminator n=1 Tax=uncultured Limosilactobacillus sp. TaxID=2837629 RepID=UPI0025E4C12E|nr:PRD domain-containing protein [uncultured Limosilactobacillus sp.]
MAKRTNKEQQLMNYLLNKRNYIPSKEIADAIHSSPKTVYRLIKKINAGSSGGELISSRRGLGYRLRYTNYLSQNMNLKEESLGELTSVERRYHILRQLLVTSPEKHKIQDTFGSFYISESVISSDIRIIRQMIQKYHLVLHRRSDYLWVTGNEKDIRTVINELLIGDDDISIGHFLKSNDNIHQTDASFITRQINLIESQLNSTIPYPYDVNLFSHLYILVERYHRVGSLISSGNVVEDRLKRAEKESPKIISALRQVINNVSNYLHTEIPNSEIFNLYQYLNSSRLEGKNTDNNHGIGTVNEREMAVTRMLIDEVTATHRLQINRDALYCSLVKHMKPLLNRLANGIKIKNSLLEQIKLEYPTLFNSVSQASAKVSQKFSLSTIDEDESGFITVYFAQAIEQMQRTINTVIVCTTGLGTAQLLKTKISNRFPELNIIKTTAVTDLSETVANEKDIQLIISTLKLPEIAGVPELICSALFSDEDQDRLSKLISQIKNGY